MGRSYEIAIRQPNLRNKIFLSISILSITQTREHLNTKTEGSYAVNDISTILLSIIIDNNYGISEPKVHGSYEIEKVLA